MRSHLCELCDTTDLARSMSAIGTVVDYGHVRNKENTIVKVVRHIPAALVVLLHSTPPVLLPSR